MWLIPHIYRTTETFLRCFGIDSLEQLPYVDLPRGKNEGEIIPLDIDVPTPNEDVEDEEIGEDTVVSVENADSTNDENILINPDEDENDLIDPSEEDDLIDPDEEDDED